MSSICSVDVPNSYGSAMSNSRLPYQRSLTEPGRSLALMIIQGPPVAVGPPPDRHRAWAPRGLPLTRAATRLRRQVPGSENRLISGPIPQDHLSRPRPTPMIESRITPDRWNSETGWHLGVTHVVMDLPACIGSRRIAWRRTPSRFLGQPLWRASQIPGIGSS